MKELAFSQIWWQFLLIAIVCYFVGCFNFARLISKLKHKDITKMGSGNPGTMNMSREFGMKIGVLTFVCDALKAGVPLLTCHLLLYKIKAQSRAGRPTMRGDRQKLGGPAK